MSKGKWNVWDGVGLPDVVPGTRVDVRYRCGKKRNNVPALVPDPQWYAGRGEASEEYWRHTGLASAMDIVAWRLSAHV